MACLVLHFNVLQMLARPRLLRSGRLPVLLRRRQRRLPLTLQGKPRSGSGLRMLKESARGATQQTVQSMLPQGLETKTLQVRNNMGRGVQQKREHVRLRVKLSRTLHVLDTWWLQAVCTHPQSTSRRVIDPVSLLLTTFWLPAFNTENFPSIVFWDCMIPAHKQCRLA